MPRTLKDINIEVGARIKEKRLAQKLTREDLAHLSGYTANFIQEVERGRSGLSSDSMSVWRRPRGVRLYLAEIESGPAAEAEACSQNN